MQELTLNVNWLAVVVGFVLAFGLGFLWYSPKMFGKTWSEGVGAKADETSGIALAMILQALGTFGFAWIVGITAASNHLLTIILITLAFAFLQAGTGKFSQHGGGAILAESGYTIAMAVIMILVHAVI